MAGRIVKLRRVPEGKIVDELYQRDDNSLIPFWAGKPIGWEVVEN